MGDGTRTLLRIVARESICSKDCLHGKVHLYSISFFLSEILQQNPRCGIVGSEVHLLAVVKFSSKELKK